MDSSSTNEEKSFWVVLSLPQNSRRVALNPFVGSETKFNVKTLEIAFPVLESRFLVIFTPRIELRFKYRENLT